MKQIREHMRYTDPQIEGLSPGFHHISYALFRTDGRLGEVVAARWPDVTLVRPGVMIQSALSTDDDAMAYLLRRDRCPAPLFVRTKVGLAMLSRCYDGEAGLGMLLHLHVRPDSGERLLRGGAIGQPSGVRFSVSETIWADETVAGSRLTAEDAGSFAALLDAYSTVRRLEKGLIPPDKGGFHTVTARALRETAEELAAFAGCALSVEGGDVSDGTPLKCYRPRLAEALLLCVLTEARTAARDRRVTLTVGRLPASDGDRMSLRLWYDVDAPRLPVRVRQEMIRARRYLVGVAELSGLSLHFPPLEVPAERRHLYRGGLPNHGVYLEWEQNPLVLSTSDLKARPIPTPEDEAWRELEAFDWSLDRVRQEKKQG